MFFYDMCRKYQKDHVESERKSVSIKEEKTGKRGQRGTGMSIDSQILKKRRLYEHIHALTFYGRQLAETELKSWDSEIKLY